VKRCCALLLGVAACQKAQTAPLYERVPVARRDVVVTATATGLIQPILTFRVKSKAWGQIVAMPVQTGDEVKKGQLLAKIDPRLPQNNLSQAQASLDKARAQLVNATGQLKRSEALFQSGSLAETDYEFTRLAYATAQAAVVNAEANLQTARDAMEDTQVRAPITGTVLAVDAVLGTVISSPTLGGGTVILEMASLDTVQDSAAVVETDVGGVRPGMPVTIIVDAYPDRTFSGTVLKILPQAQVVQNTTMFPVLVDIANPGHLLKPGMNTDVRIHIGGRQGVLAIPSAALRTKRDVGSAAQLLGLDSQAVQRNLAGVQPAAGAQGTAATFTTTSGRTGGAAGDSAGAGAGGGRGGRGGRGAGRNGSGRASSYFVFALRGGAVVPVSIRTGLSDQEYIEVTSGLTETDSVLVLPSASLVQSQQQFRQRFQTVTGGGLPGLRQQQQPAAAPR
jgi:HlyD family secretion protein